MNNKKIKKDKYFFLKKSFQKNLPYFPDISVIYLIYSSIYLIYLRYFNRLPPLLCTSFHARFFRQFISSKPIFWRFFQHSSRSIIDAQYPFEVIRYLIYRRNITDKNRFFNPCHHHH